MKSQCENGHPIDAEGQKFCGECGAAASGGEGACECGATFAKGANFCLNCGQPAAPMGVELSTALDEVDSYIKARGGIADDMALPQLDPEDHSASADVERILKAAAVRDKDSGEEIGVDAVPVVSAFMKGMGDLANANQMYAEHTTDLLRATLDGQTVIMKAVVALGRKVEQIANAPSGPRPLAGLGEIVKAGGANGARGATRGGEFDNLRGADLLLKAVVAAEKNPDLLSTQEIAICEHFGNNEGTLADMRATHPEVAARVEHALRETRTH